MSLTIHSLGPLFDMSRDAVVGVENGNIVFANPAAQASLPLRPGDAAAEHIPEHILSVAAERFVASGNIAGRSADFSAVRSGDGMLITIVCRPEGSVPLPIQARALNELGNDLLTARLALDAVVNGTNAETDPKLSQYAAILYQSYYRIKRLHSHMTMAGSVLQDMLPCAPKLIELDVLCRELCGTVAALVRDMGIDLAYEAHDAPCPVLADVNLMETMLLNLLSNSLLHAKEGDRVLVSLSRHGQRIVIAVDDRGSGMAGDTMANLFAGAKAPDLTDVSPGAGMGLTIVRGIAEKHGGTLILESREGKGTRLRISLPEAAPPDIREFHHPEVSYRTDGMNLVLTELSVVLDKKFYNRKSFD